MREIHYIVLHCTATRPEATVKAIQRYWREVLKWKSPGYHYIIQANGFVRLLLSENKIANGVKGFNTNAIHISYIGGIDEKGIPEDTRTPAQLFAMKNLVKILHAKYPMAVIQGHRDFPNVKKACPSFDAKKWILKEGLMMPDASMER